MSKNNCSTELLISSDYCQLSFCRECNIVNLNLPGRISFQFDLHQFFDIANAFNKAALILTDKLAPKQKSAKVISLKHSHKH